MVKLHPEIVKKDGKAHSVVLPYEEFEAVRESLHDLEDLRELRAAKAAEGDAPTLTLAQVKHELGLDEPN